jgi:hypothetical protein
VPHFAATNLPKPLSPLYPYHLPPAVVSLAETYTLSPDLLALLSEITAHTTSSLVTHETANLQYRFLSLLSTHPYQHPLPSSTIPTKTCCSQVHQEQSEMIQELFLIGGVLFLSLPHMCALLPIRPIDYGYLLSRLTVLASSHFDSHTLRRHPEFLLWLSFLGVVFSSPSISFSTRAREPSWLLLQLRVVSAVLEITSWEEMKMALGTMWAIEQRHEMPYRCLWEEAVIDLDICSEV